MLLHPVQPSRKVKLALGDACDTSVESIPSEELPAAHRWPVAVETSRGQSALNKKFVLKEFTWNFIFFFFFVLPLRKGRKCSQLFKNIHLSAGAKERASNFSFCLVLSRSKKRECLHARCVVTLCSSFCGGADCGQG